jgi:hypothetical protein
MNVLKDYSKASFFLWLVGVKFCKFFHCGFYYGSIYCAFCRLYSALVVIEGFYNIFVFCYFID